MKPRLAFCFLLLIGISALHRQTAIAGEREVSFKTEDGWTIYGTLTTPDAEAKAPVVILLPSESHDRSAFGVYRYPGQYQYPGLVPVINGRGVATLSLDLRGRGKSLGSKELSSFSAEELSKLYLDVRAAISFLESQPDVDSSRMGIVAEGASADAAVRGWGGDSRIKAMVLISGRLSQAAKEQIAANPTMPLLLLVSSEDKKGFADMTDAYFLSKSRESDIEVYSGLGMGTAMFSVWRYKFPKEKLLHETVGEWIADQLLLTGQLTEVSFETRDGWTIYGNLRVPEGMGKKVPAVILLHSGLSDRYAYSELEVALAKQGLAVLNIDWRGKGKSTGKGQYFELSREERDKGHLDVKAAVDFLASQPNIEVNSVGVLGTAIGARYAIAAAVEEPRIRTAVVLTGYAPNDKEKAHITATKMPVLYVTSTGHGTVTQPLIELYQSTKEIGTELLVYEGGALGYQLFKLDDSLLPRVVQWMKEKLAR